MKPIIQIHFEKLLVGYSTIYTSDTCGLDQNYRIFKRNLIKFWDQSFSVIGDHLECKKPFETFNNGTIKNFNKSVKLQDIVFRT